MARPRKGEELNASFSVRCNTKLLQDLHRLARLSNVSTNEYARLVLQHAIDQDVIAIESFEETEKRLDALIRRSEPIPEIKRTLLFRGPVETNSSHQAKMRKAMGMNPD